MEEENLGPKAAPMDDLEAYERGGLGNPPEGDQRDEIEEDYDREGEENIGPKARLSERGGLGNPPEDEIEGYDRAGEDEENLGPKASPLYPLGNPPDDEGQ